MNGVPFEPSWGDGLLQVLSLDGGGLKGLFSAALLEALEQDLGARLIDHFDLIVATSTGGLIALGLGAGLSPTEIVDFYVSRGPRIFSQRGRVRQVVAAKHRPGPLKAALEEVFGTRRMWQSRTRLVIPSYSLDARDVYVFKTPHHPRLRRDYRETMVDVAMATTAAPTFLPAFRLRNNRLVDGGVWATNPTLVAVAEATGLLGATTEQVRVLSLGTTDELHGAGRGLEDGGLLQWGLRGAPWLLRAQSQAADHAVEHLLGRGRVTRIDPVVPTGTFALDRVDATRIRGLAEDEARRWSEQVAGFLAHRAEPFVPMITTDSGPTA